MTMDRKFGREGRTEFCTKSVTKSQCGSHKTDTLSMQNSSGKPLEARFRNGSGPV
jgi:hypothetical protein